MQQPLGSRARCPAPKHVGFAASPAVGAQIPRAASSRRPASTDVAGPRLPAQRWLGSGGGRRKSPAPRSSCGGVGRSLSGGDVVTPGGFQQVALSGASAGHEAFQSSFPLPARAGEVAPAGAGLQRRQDPVSTCRCSPRRCAGGSAGGFTWGVSGRARGGAGAVAAAPSAEERPGWEKRRLRLAASPQPRRRSGTGAGGKVPRGAGCREQALRGPLATLSGVAAVMQIACKWGLFDLLTFLWGHVCLGKWF